MWLVKNSKGEIYYLKPGKITSFGRKEADIVLANDTSISRSHANITVILKDEIMVSGQTSICIIKDTKSKYGTYLIRNGSEKKIPLEGLELQHMDFIKFGLQQHIYTVEYISIVTVISRLNVKDRIKLKEIMDNVDGVILDFYNNNCTHLTMTMATSTNKVISALLAAIPIVNIDYWISVEKAVESNNNLPDPTPYILSLVDKGVNTQRVSLVPNPSRKSLFNKKTFVFFIEKSYDNYKKIIESAGGKAELHSISVNETSENYFSDTVIVMQMTTDSITEELSIFYTILCKKLQKRNIRTIAETEIPLAILYSSLDQYCNPKYHFKKLIKRKSVRKDTSEILAVDTQDIFTSESNLKIHQTCIPETNDFVEENIVEGIETSLKKNEENTSEKEKSSKKSQNVKPDERNEYTDSIPPFLNQEKKKLNERDIDYTIKNESFKKAECVRNYKNMESDTSMKISDLKNINHENNTDYVEQNSILNLNESNNKKRKGESFFQLHKIRKIHESNWTTENKIVEYYNQKENNFFNNISQTKVPEKIKDKIEENQQNNLHKWGFKKSEKKAIDFDLDNVNRLYVNQDIKEHKGKEELTSNINITKLSGRKNIVNEDRAIEVNKNFVTDRNVSIESSNREINATSGSHTNNKNFKKTIPEFDNCSLIRPRIEDQRNFNEIKVFKKVKSEVPIKRISLSDMSI